MSEQNRNLALTWFNEVWNNANDAAIDDLFHPHGRAFFPGPAAGPDLALDPPTFKLFAAALRSSFTDLHLTVDDTVVERDKVAVRWTARMRHTGPALGIPPTGSPVILTGLSIMQVEGGRILHGWNSFDMTAIAAHLSTLPAA